MTARWRLGDFAILADQEERAVKHYMIAAKGGYKDALDAVRREVADGNATKEQYEEALRAYQKSMDDRKSESRELYSEMKTSSVAEVVRKQKGNDAWLAGL
jgi:gamma-glutamyl:cysteine ligase YbdK (ATP-grasp superfamily)